MEFMLIVTLIAIYSLKQLDKSLERLPNFLVTLVFRTKGQTHIYITNVCKKTLFDAPKLGAFPPSSSWMRVSLFVDI